MLAERWCGIWKKSASSNPRSRDPQDDPYLAAALSARAVIVTYDKDLLDLGKPFGVEILRPSVFLKRFTA